MVDADAWPNKLLTCKEALLLALFRLQVVRFSAWRAMTSPVATDKMFENRLELGNQFGYYDGWKARRGCWAEVIWEISVNLTENNIH